VGRSGLASRTRGFQLSGLTGHSAPDNLYIGCAGWSLGRTSRHEFPVEGTHLQRYAAIFRAVEINSSFHRPHRVTTYVRWGECVPESFRFAVKLPRAITHEKRLADADELVDVFLREVSGLGNRLGCLLIQLPPSLEFDPAIAERFLGELQRKYSGDLFIEPRHRSWFEPDANKLLQDARVGRVAADPAVIPVAAEPGGSPAKVYYRLHGSPRIYYSAYTEGYLDGLAFRLRAYARAGVPVWCIFDNTIRGEAMINALYLIRKIGLSEIAEARR
jgi:uncharacterized protein YecE (DUF72 family)